MKISMKTVVGLVLPLCALGLGLPPIQQNFLTPHVQNKTHPIGKLDASHMWSLFAVQSRDVVIGIELVFLVAVYTFAGVNTASYVSNAFGCSWSLAMLFNIAIWPITTIVAFFALSIQRVRTLMYTWNNPTSATDNANVDNLLTLVQHGTPQIFVARLIEKLAGVETVTPEILVDKLQIPRANAVRWHKWLARGHPELSLNMLLCRAAELHKSEGKKICRILFEIYDEDDDGVLSRSEATEVLQNWCIGKYGATVLKNDAMVKLVETLMSQVSFNEGDINKIEWIRLADSFPELFERDSRPEHVQSLRLWLLCRVRMWHKPLHLW